ncbi:MAG TPA: hypothetical protein VHA30_00860 [Patescibacteria group bacterium]|nr:hypothetical protein [Patescibacteria group bacterium]
MPQINLLKQPAQARNPWETIFKVGSGLFIAVLACLVIYYGWLFYRSSRIDKDVASLTAQAENDQQQALTVPGRDELFIRQQQLQNFSDLMASHVYYSQIIPKLAAATLKNASYSSLQVDNTGQLVLSASVPDLASLDKYMMVFNRPDVNKYFSNVKIGSFHKVQGANGGPSSISFDVTMQYDPSIINYAAGK